MLSIHSGEEKEEPEVDLSSFLERQRLSETPSALIAPPEIDDEVDDSAVSIFKNTSHATHKNKKGQVQQIQWDEQLEEMSRNKATTEAARGEYYTSISIEP